MSNVLTLKTKWQDSDAKRFNALKRHLDKLRVPYPLCHSFDELLAYVSQDWILELIMERWKVGVIASLYGDEYETIH